MSTPSDTSFDYLQTLFVDVQKEARTDGHGRKVTNQFPVMVVVFRKCWKLCWALVKCKCVYKKTLLGDPKEVYRPTCLTQPLDYARSFARRKHQWCLADTRMPFTNTCDSVIPWCESLQVASQVYRVIGFDICFSDKPSPPKVLTSKVLCGMDDEHLSTLIQVCDDFVVM